MLSVNLVFGWSWIALGFVAGAVIGMRFHEPEWLGGYSSLSRRMLRLGHIAMVALGALNILAVLTFKHRDASDNAWIAMTPWLWILGAVLMPACCFATAWRERFRLLFFVPVLALLAAAIGTVIIVIMNTRGGVG